MARRLAAILAADVVGYARLMGADEAGTLEAVKALRRELFAPEVAAHHGRIFKLMGDGALVEFASVVDAVNCAVTLQRALAERNADRPSDKRVELRIGVNLGDVIIEGGDVYGDGVNLAARLEQLSPAGGICLSASAYEQIEGKIDEPFADLGEQAVKNFAKPVRIRCWTPDSRPGPHVVGAAARETRETGQAALAVLPLMNLSNHRQLDFLADGLSEDIITMLARLPGFLVISRNSSFAYKGKTVDVRDVGRELGVDYVVEGSLRPVGGKIRVTVQLVESDTGNHLWANRFDQPAEQIDELQDEITLGVASRLVPELARAEVERIKRRGDLNPDSWGLYNRASGLLSLKGWHRETFEEATRLLRQAVELDPDFALGHAYLSLIFALGHMFDLAPADEDSRDRAIAAAERAMDLDNRSAAVLGFAGCALSDVGLVARSIGILERAVEADPSNAQAWVALGTAMLRSGKARKGVEMLRHGMRISPLDNRLSFWGTNLAYALFRLRDFDEAEAEIRRACKRDDKNYMSMIVLALIMLQKGQAAEARQAVEAAQRLRPGLACDDVKPLIGRRGVQLLQKAELLR